MLLRYTAESAQLLRAAIPRHWALVALDPQHPPACLRPTTAAHALTRSYVYAYAFGACTQAEEALLKAAEDGDLTTLTRLVKQGVNVNATGKVSAAPRRSRSHPCHPASPPAACAAPPSPPPL